MIVCSCNVLTDQDVRSAVCPEGGMARTAGEVYGCLGCSVQCGRCARTIRTIMTEALRDEAFPTKSFSTAPAGGVACCQKRHADVERAA